MISTGQVSVGTAPTLLGTLEPAATWTLSVPGTVAVYIGGSTVTASTGAPVNGAITITCPATSAAAGLWACTASGTAGVGLIVSTGR